MNTNKFVVVIAFFVAASLGFAQGMRGTGGGGMAGQPIDGTAIFPSSVSASGNITSSTLNVGTTASSIRAQFLTEGNTTGTYAPTNFDDKFAVFGRSATTGANSGGVFLTYHFGDNEGVIGALSPAIAWRPLRFVGSEWKFQQAGNLVMANITSTGAFNSVAVSGNQAFTCTNTGCRLSLGNTGRYLVDDGTNLEFIAPVQATSFDATNTSGNAITGGNSSTSFNITSNTPDSVTSATVGAFTFQSSQALTINDAVLVVKNSAGTDLLRVRSRTDGVGVVVAGNFDADFAGRGLINFSNPVELTSWMTPSSSSVGAKIGAYTNFTSDTSKTVQVINNTAEVAHFSKDGLLRVNSANAAKPTCNANNRGRVFYLDGAASVADTYEICMKNASDVYAWKTIVTP